MTSIIGGVNFHTYFLPVPPLNGGGHSGGRDSFVSLSRSDKRISQPRSSTSVRPHRGQLQMHNGRDHHLTGAPIFYRLGGEPFDDLPPRPVIIYNVHVPYGVGVAVPENVRAGIPEPVHSSVADEKRTIRHAILHLENSFDRSPGFIGISFPVAAGGSGEAGPQRAVSKTGRRDSGGSGGVGGHRGSPVKRRSRSVEGTARATG